jgi:hypothetical protein
MPRGDLLPLLYELLSDPRGVPIGVWGRALILWGNAFARRDPPLWTTILRLDRLKNVIMLIEGLPLRTPITHVTLGVTIHTDRESWIHQITSLLEGYPLLFSESHLREFAVCLRCCYPSPPPLL